MEPKCSVCTNQYRKEIDLALASGSSARSQAVRYAVSQTAMQRHKLKHLVTKAKAVVVQQAVHKAKQADKAEEQHQKAVADVWLTRLDGAYKASADGMERAAADPDKWHLGAQFIGQAIKACDAGLRASGAISPGSTTINVDRMLVLPLASAGPLELPAGDVVDVEAVETDDE